MDKRYRRVQWGPHGERVRTAPANWRKPIIWNKHFAAFQAEHGRRQQAAIGQHRIAPADLGVMREEGHAEGLEQGAQRIGLAGL